MNEAKQFDFFLRKNSSNFCKMKTINIYASSLIEVAHIAKDSNKWFTSQSTQYSSSSFML